MSALRYYCIHGHFYQPPRENPWLEAIDPDPSSYPYPNWNQRILAECYRPNTAARILDDQDRIEHIANNYAALSFNVGPTLLAWLEQAAPDVYQAVLDADQDSAARFGGHGSAMAQVYNHVIMPLASARDRRTQVMWGMRDFERRFGRVPEGMWLPETAVDLASLAELAEHGIGFTVLAPHQAVRVRRPGGAWVEVPHGSIETGRVYRALVPGGRSIDVYFYDGPSARAVAFERLLASGVGFAERLLQRPPGAEPWLHHIATDGESYGHHHRFGEMALAYAVRHIDAHRLAQATNYAQFRELEPPAWEVEVAQGSSWSCAHGIERWRSDCGCNASHPQWSQAWRGPLRDAFDWLRDRAAEIFESESADLFADPWAARDHYIDVVADRSDASVDAFLGRHAPAATDRGRRRRALELLEMQRNAMLMYTSCGWFFDDVSGIEAAQVLSFAARCVELAERYCDRPLEPELVDRLALARSNVAEYRDGRGVWERLVRPRRVGLAQVTSHFAVASLLAGSRDQGPVRTYCYRVIPDHLDVHRAGKAKVAVGRVRVESLLTHESAQLGFAAVHHGDHNLSGGVRGFDSDEDYRAMARAVIEPFDHGDLVGVQRVLDRCFPELGFSLKSLFPTERDRALARILEGPLAEAEQAYRRLYEHDAPLMRFLAGNDIPVPAAFARAAEVMWNLRLRRALESEAPRLDEIAAGVAEARALHAEIDREGLAYAWEGFMERLTARLVARPDDVELIQALTRATAMIDELGLDVDLWRVQTECWRLARTGKPEPAFLALCVALKIRPPG